MTETPGRSLWADTLDVERHRVVREMPTDADVAIIGAGYTGLWTAWYLLQRAPSTRVVVVEREHVGFGASGRNGGWCSALLPMSLDAIAKRHGPAAATRMQRAMHRSVEEVGRFVDEHGPAGTFHQGGTIQIARSAAQAERFRRELGTYRRFGFDDTDYRWLGVTEAETMCNATDIVGALFTPHCAAVHPGRLVHSLARAVEGAGGTICEGVRAERIDPGRLTTDAGTIRSDVVVRATEGYTSQLPGHRRAMLPLWSMMIATPPLPDDAWAEIGLHDRPTFADGRHLIIYGQRTADGRLAFGGRGAPYHFGSKIRSEFDTDHRIRDLLRQTLIDLFPVLRDVEVTHHWGGVLGMPADLHCSVRFDRATGLASAGGYVGDGVGAAHLAGRTLAALIADDVRAGDDEAELTKLPWVGHRSPRWPLEPLRWLGVNAGLTAAGLADRRELRTGRGDGPSQRLVEKLLRR